MLISHQPQANRQVWESPLRHDHLTGSLAENETTNASTSASLRHLQSAIANLKIAIAAVPVVQRIEQGFPKP